jgi:hypothetical protein
MRQTIRLKPNGIIEDVAEVEVPETAWTGGKNVRFYNGATQKCGGYEATLTGGVLQSDIEYMVPIDTGSAYYWACCGDDSIEVTNGATTYTITPAAGVNANPDIGWNGGILNGLLVLNNGVDNPIWWDGDTLNAMTDLTNWPASTQAKVIRPFKNYLIALNITETSTNYENMVRTSHYADPGASPTSWDYTDATKDCVRTVLADTPGGVIDCKQLRDFNVIYKERSTYIMEYIGGQFVFSFRLLFNDTGIMTTNCAVELKGRHIVMTKDDVIAHDGNSYESIVDGTVREWLFNQINPKKTAECFLALDEGRDEVWICYPSGSADYANRALIWNANTGTFGVRELPNAPFISYGIGDFSDVSTWATIPGTWGSVERTWAGSGFKSTSLVMAVDAATTIYTLDATNTENGTDMEAYIERLSLPLFGDDTTKLVRHIRPKITAPTGAQIVFRVGAQMNEDDPITWADPVTYTVGTTDKVDTLVKGRYISFRISSDTDISWSLESMNIEADVKGTY